MRKNLLLVLLLCSLFSVNAQVNSVVLKTSSTDIPVGSFASVQLAYNAIPASVTQAYIIEIGAAYTGASETYPIVFSVRNGTSNDNSITLRPAPAANGVSITGNLSGGNILTIDNADYITIDGRAAGVGTSRALTIQNTATTSNSNTIQLINGASNNTITYCNINNASGTAAARALAISTSVSNASGNSNNLISYCQFPGGRYLINSNGTAANPNTNNRIFGCEFINFKFVAVWAQVGTGKLIVDSCKIYHTAAANEGVYGILFDSQGDSAIITRNSIFDLNTGTSSAAVKGISVRSSLAENYVYIHNNFINLASSPASTNVSGIEILTTGATVSVNAGIYYNTIKVGGVLSGGGTSGAVVSAPLLRSATTATNSLVIKNNILVNERQGGAAGTQHVALALTNNGSSISSDYNTYNSTTGNLVRAGAVVYSSVAAYQASVGAENEVNSNSTIVQLASATDLHLGPTMVGNRNLIATAIPGILTDIDNQLRGSVPYRGADELPGAPLPVNLLAFLVKASGKDIVLNWTTASEINNSGFEIERSEDAINFNKVAFVKTAGNNVGRNNYEYRDVSVFTYLRAAKLYYRLAQKDLNGRIKYSDIRFVNISSPKEASVIVYPNPVVSASTLYIHSASTGNATLTIRDHAGRLISNMKLVLQAGDNVISLPQTNIVAKGVYIVTIEGAINKSVSMIKQ